jgi:enoyl-CoA hydratase/carnithine racemase
MSHAELVREQHDAVLLLRLNRPEARNALTPALIDALATALEEAESSDDIRAVVITGTGDRAFCAGMDLRGFAAGEDAPDESQARGFETFERFLRGGITVPIVGAANATAVGGGFEMLLACDLVVASAEARFALPEVKRGLFPTGGGVLLGARLPLAVALEMTLTGDFIDAARAAELGLVNRVVGRDEVVDAALALAARVTRNGPLAVQAIKELVWIAAGDVPRARSRQEHWQTVVFESEDAREGVAAFIERRDPVWRGR